MSILSDYTDRAISTVPKPISTKMSAGVSDIYSATKKKKKDSRTPQPPSAAKSPSKSKREKDKSGIPFLDKYGNTKLPKNLTIDPGKDPRVDQRAIQALREQGLSPASASVWNKLQQQQIKEQEKADISNLRQQGAGELAGARSSLAMRGGLGGGAAERLAMAGERSSLLGAQGVRGGSRKLSLGAETAAEENRLNILRGLPGQEVANIQPEMENRRINIGVQGQNVGNILGAMGQQEQIDAAARTAGAYEESTKPGPNIFAQMSPSANIFKNTQYGKYFDTAADPLRIGGKGGSQKGFGGLIG